MRRIAAPLLLVITACSTGPAIDTSVPPQGTAAIRNVVVLDGDTVRADIRGVSEEIRLLGINAPERDECLASEARDTLIELVTSASDIEVVTDGRDQFDRLLGYLSLDGEVANIELVSTGYAIAVAADHDLLPDMLAAEQTAVALERGVWSPSACGSDGSGRTVSIWAIEPDAPGRDDTNPNGEWVAVTTEGSSVDLGGWMLRDESSTHRYTFPDGFELEDGAIVTVRSGCGADTETDLYWCADTTVWNNAGDTVLLLDPFGAVVSRERYRG